MTTARPIKSVPIATAGKPRAGAANSAPSAGRATAKLMTKRTTSRRPQAASPWVIATAYPTGRPDLIRPRVTSVPATTSGSNTTWMASIVSQRLTGSVLGLEELEVVPENVAGQPDRERDQREEIEVGSEEAEGLPEQSPHAT